MQALHSWWCSAGWPASRSTEEEIEHRQPQAVHPLVHVHPGSGRKSLYIASHAREIVGMDRAEGRALLDAADRARDPAAIHLRPTMAASATW